jgi:predicted transposase YbfD/YdcC
MSIATLTARRAARCVSRSRVDFAAVEDPRAPHLIRYAVSGLLNLIVAGFAAGQPTLRDIETFVRDIPGRCRRALGLGSKHKPCDSTLYNLLARLEPTGFRRALVRQVVDAVKAKAITNDLLARGVVAFDGHGGIDDWGRAPTHQARNTIKDMMGTPLWYLYSLRAHLVSSSACPCLDQEFIDDDHWEDGLLPSMLRRVAGAFPRLFEIVTADAVFLSKANTEAVISLGKHYLFALKRNRPKLYDDALDSLRGRPLEAETEEHTKGVWVHRALFRARCPRTLGYSELQQFVAVVQTTIKPTGEKAVETRLFVTSLARKDASPRELLKLVRLHWGIENNGNWTMDEQFSDDRRCPCKRNEGSIVVSWLRLLSFNIASTIRSRLPGHDRGRRVSWRRTIQLIWMAFLTNRSEVPTLR